jgi:acetylglutamate kinase
MKILLLKLSGKVMDDLFVNDFQIEIIKELKNSYDAVIIVHGGGIRITQWSEKLGIKTKFWNGHRITDSSTMEVVVAVQAGLINGKLVSRLQTNHINSIGLTGIDNGLFSAEYLNEELGFVGIPVFTGKKDWLISILKDGIVPVFSSVCQDNKGNLMNVNSDLFTKELAIAIQADTVIYLSDIEGVKINGFIQSHLTGTDIKTGFDNKQITDGMIPKLESCLDLLKAGINKVWIGNDLSAFNDSLETKLKGTWIVNSEAVEI